MQKSIAKTAEKENYEWITMQSVRMVQLSINKKLKVWKQVKEPLEISSIGAEI